MREEYGFAFYEDNSDILNLCQKPKGGETEDTIMLMLKFGVL